jgi:16S rRNA (guanine527-N7)-methyltransferase
VTRADDPSAANRLEPLDPPAHAAELFGARFPLASAYAQLLATTGVQRGLIGPRETGRLWDRHLVNCALLADELPVGTTVVDVGSGAGLPGIVLAIRRPDLTVVLVEPMQRRVEFLLETVDALGLGEQVRVIRGRAEDAGVRRELGPVDWVVARAVAPLDRLMEWCLPLLAPGGWLLALKGSRAPEELAEAAAALRRLRVVRSEIRELGGAEGIDRTTVVAVAAPERRERGRR